MRSKLLKRVVFWRKVMFSPHNTCHYGSNESLGDADASDDTSCASVDHVHHVRHEEVQLAVVTSIRDGDIQTIHNGHLETMQGWHLFLCWCKCCCCCCSQNWLWFWAQQHGFHWPLAVHRSVDILHLATTRCSNRSNNCGHHQSKCWGRSQFTRWSTKAWDGNITTNVHVAVDMYHTVAANSCQ